MRVPFTQEFVLGGRGTATGADYLAALDQVVTWAEACGIYTLLDLQWIDADTPHGIGQDGSINRVPSLPDGESIELWRILASHYRDRPSVLFDLFNEPHTPMQTDDAPLVGIRPDGGLWRLPARVVGMDEWQPWALRLVAEIRDAHPTSVIFVSGVRWAYDLRGFPLRRRSGHAVEGLVYSTHVYPWTTIGLWPGRRPEQEWHRAFGHLAAAYPVFAGEWGGGPTDVDWGRRLLAYLEATTVGWTAWSWCDWPPLLADHRGGDCTPTPFGELVRAGLRKAGRRTGVQEVRGAQPPKPEVQACRGVGLGLDGVLFVGEAERGRRLAQGHSTCAERLGPDALHHPQSGGRPQDERADREIEHPHDREHDPEHRQPAEEPARQRQRDRRHQVGGRCPEAGQGFLPAAHFGGQGQPERRLGPACGDGGGACGGPIQGRRGLRPVEGSYEQRDGVVGVQPDLAGVAPDEGSPEDAIRPARDVVALEALQQGAGDLGAGRDGLEGDAGALALAAEPGAQILDDGEIFVRKAICHRAPRPGKNRWSMWLLRGRLPRAARCKYVDAGSQMQA